VSSDKARKVIVDAPAAAGTPASQDALCAVARDLHLPAHARAEAVSSLGLIKRPTERTMTAISDLIRIGDPRLATSAAGRVRARRTRALSGRFRRARGTRRSPGPGGGAREDRAR
jgi:hypothetical protein